MATLCLTGSALCLVGALILATAPIRHTRRGGIRFFRIGRAQFSFCRCRSSI